MACDIQEASLDDIRDPSDLTSDKPLIWILPSREIVEARLLLTAYPAPAYQCASAKHLIFISTPVQVV